MKDLLKFITCGSVDDGKSTLIGNLLYNAKLLYTDQKQALKLESQVHGGEGKLDYSLLLDGLMAEREQGITIDVAYRYFATDHRSFIVADTPGHEEYTRNMAVGASFAELSVLLIDAVKGISTQTMRHIRICSLMGIRYFVFAVNKMDLVGYQKERFDKIAEEIDHIMEEFTWDSCKIIPVSATEGDNITESSSRMPWYEDKTFLYYLENVDVTGNDGMEDIFVMPVQRVSRGFSGKRGYQGQVEHGRLQVGEEVTILPSREKAVVENLYFMDHPAEKIEAGWPVTICLNREVDISRGCVIVKNNGDTKHPSVSNMCRVQLLWMDDDELVEGRNYFMKCGTRTIAATVMKLHYKINVQTGEKLQVQNGIKNDLIACDLYLLDNIVLEEFEKSRALGSFILINRVTNQTAACGTVTYSLRRAENIYYNKMDITREIRAKQLGQNPCTIWFTGLSGAGKSMIANALEKKLVLEGYHTMLLDGDNVRFGLNKNLGFKEADRIENVRRVAEVAKLMNDAGLIVLVALISPYERDRQMARDIIGENFCQVYVSTPLEICEKRDVKGLYKKAREGLIPNFTGVTSPYEVPACSEFVINSTDIEVEEAADQICRFLKSKYE